MQAPSRQALLEAILAAFGKSGDGAYDSDAPQMAEASLAAVRAQLAGCQPLNVYLYGSHLHGCAGPRSDYDFVVVVTTSAYFPGIRRVALPFRGEGEGEVASMELDLNVYHVDYFRQLVDQNVVMVLTAVFAPPEAVLMACVDFRSTFPLRLPLLRVYVNGFLNAKWRRAQHYWKKDKRDSKKIVSTVLRYLLLALALRRDGAIHDITIGNDYYWEIMTCEEENWQYYVDQYRPLATSLAQELKELSDDAKHLISDEFLCPGKSSTTLALRELGIRVICQELGIASQRHAKYPHLVSLISDSSVSPLHSPIVRECQGIVLDENDNWRALCIPPAHTGSYWYEYCSEPAKKKKKEIKSQETEGLYISSSDLQWNHQDMWVYHDLDGAEASLFFYNGEWLLSSRWSADASQPLLDLIDRRKGKHHNPFTFLEEQLQDLCEARICDEIKSQSEKDGIFTVADLFWNIWKSRGYILPQEESKCYTFEICSRRYPHITKECCEEDTIRLLSVRDRDSLEELDPRPIAERYGWNCIDMMPLPEVLSLVDDDLSIPFWALENGNKHEVGKRARRRKQKRMRKLKAKAQNTSQSTSKNQLTDTASFDEHERVEERIESDDASEMVAQLINENVTRDRIVNQLLYQSTKLDPMKHAGLIVMDNQYHRIKIESPQYRILRNLFLAQQPTVLERLMVDFVRTNDKATFLQFYPEWRSLFEDVRARYSSMCSYVTEMYGLVKNLDKLSYHEWVKSYNEQLPSSLLYWLNGFRQHQVKEIHRLLSFCPLDKLIVLFNQFETEVLHRHSSNSSNDVPV